MTDEFDDMVAPTHGHCNAGKAGPGDTRREVPAARLISRLYRTARPPLRVRLLGSLLRPLGPLAMVGIAAGAFGRFLYMHGASDANAAMDDFAHFSNEQISELVRFVEQVSPEALQEFARPLSENPVGMAAFSATVMTLLVRKLRGPGPSRPARTQMGGR